jgi:hypothetical protein
MDELYNPEHNQYIPEHIAEDYNQHSESVLYKADVVMETPLDKTLKTLVNEVLK